MDANKIRTAWFDRKENKYDYGSWHLRNNLSEFEKWVSIQNTKYIHVFYWIEEMDNNVVINLQIKNIEKGPTQETDLSTDLSTNLSTDSPTDLSTDLSDNVFIRDFIILPVL